MNAGLDLLYTDIEESLRDSVRTLLRKRYDPRQGAALFDGDRTGTDDLWHALAADLGLAGLLVPEEFGGAGATAREAAVVLEELGRSVSPVPFLTSGVVATTVLREGGCTELLSSVAAGGVVAALALPLSAGPGAVTPAVTVHGGRLHGLVTSVAGALEADLLLVPAAGEDGLELHAVPVSRARVEPVACLDMTRQLADIDVTGAAAQPLALGGHAEAAIRRALQAGTALLASEQLGIAQWCLDTTVEYLGVRRQFGRVVGGFQALKHRLADLYVQVESARAAARYAAATLAAADPDTDIAASLAQAYCGDIAVHAAEECIQLHGGIGMTWEHPAHLYLKRAKADQIAFGTSGAHYTRLAGLVDLPAGVS
jgi:alkylation response protein AidB-like acyl-CoA dehydrogenase